VLLCAGAPLLAPAAAIAAAASATLPGPLALELSGQAAEGAGVQDAAPVADAQAEVATPAVFTVSTSGDPQQAALLNAATTSWVVVGAYRRSGVEVAGVQVAGADAGPLHTVSTSGDPDSAALLNAATMLRAGYPGDQPR
jgi:hypothetical protein